MDEWDWKLVRFELFNALDCLNIHDIFLIEKEDGNVVTISIVASDVAHLRPLVRMRLIDTLIERHRPDLYNRYMFCYEVWDKKEWERISARRFFHRTR